MRVILDDVQLLDDATTLDQGLRAGADRANELGRLIVEVAIDGEPLPGDLLDDPTRHEGGGEELRMTSAEPAAFLRVTLMEAADALEQARAEQLAAADRIDEGQTPQAFEALGVALGVWDAVRHLVERTSQLLGFDLSGAVVRAAGEDLSVDESIARLAKHLEEVRRAVAAEDWAGLSDVLRDELSEEASRWRDLLRGLAEAVRNADGRE